MQSSTARGYHDWQPSFGARSPNPCDVEQRPCRDVDVLRYPLHRHNGGFPRRYAHVVHHSGHLLREDGSVPHPEGQ